MNDGPTIDLRGSLESLRPLIGNHEWMWRILRRRRARSGSFPYRLYPLLRRFGRRAQPLFISATHNGIQFVGDYRDRYSAICAVCAEFDRTVVQVVCERASQRPGCVLDIGANMGIVAASIARCLPDRDVLAFEPAAGTSQRAAATLELNGVGNVRLYNCAVGDMEGNVDFWESEVETESATMTPCMKERRRRDMHWSCTRVPLVTVDGLVASEAIGPVAAMKVDVEGYEPNVIRGACNAIRRFAPNIVFEYHPAIAPRLGWHVDDVLGYLPSRGDYRFYSVPPDGAPQPYPPLHTDGVTNILCAPGSRESSASRTELE